MEFEPEKENNQQEQVPPYPGQAQMANPNQAVAYANPVNQPISYQGNPTSQPAVVQWQPVAVVQPPTASVNHPQNVAVTTNLPKYALIISVVTTIVFTGVLYWIPGLFCLVPALGTAVAGIIKKEKQKILEARKYGIISLILVIVFYISYPILVAVVIVSSVFGYINRPRQRCYYYYSYHRSYYC